MARGSPKWPRSPKVTTCAGCGRTIETSRYGGYPLEGTPPSRITYRTAPGRPKFSIACTCGHYTVYE